MVYLASCMAVERLLVLGLRLPLPKKEMVSWIEPLALHLGQKLSLEKGNSTFYLVEDIEEAEKILFDTSISCILGGTQSDETLSFINALKADELFRHLPVVLFSSSEQRSKLREFIPSADLILDISTPVESIVDFLCPLLEAKAYTDELEKKISYLQDEWMNKYLLIDLIKRYMPRTVWERANSFAEEQAILIPEYEEEVAILYGGYHRVYPDGRASSAEGSDRFIVDVHYGPVIRGNLGSDLRSDNTLIGYTVNTAARIQGVATPEEVLASEAVVNKAGIVIPMEYKREMQFRGRKEPLVVYDVYRYFKESGKCPDPVSSLAVHLPGSSN